MYDKSDVYQYTKLISRWSDMHEDITDGKYIQVEDGKKRHVRLNTQWSFTCNPTTYISLHQIYTKKKFIVKWFLFACFFFCQMKLSIGQFTYILLLRFLAKRVNVSLVADMFDLIFFPICFYFFLLKYSLRVFSQSIRFRMTFNVVLKSMLLRFAQFP